MLLHFPPMEGRFQVLALHDLGDCRPGHGQNRRQDVDVADQCLGTFSFGHDTRLGEDQRNPHSILKEGVFLADAVSVEHLPVIGGVDDEGVLTFGQRTSERVALVSLEQPAPITHL